MEPVPSPNPVAVPTNVVPTNQIIMSDDKAKTYFGGIKNYLFEILEGKRRIRVFLIGLLIGILSSIQPAYWLYTKGLPYIRELDLRVNNIVEETIPDDVEVSINNGQASSNVNEPYFLTISIDKLENIWLPDSGNGRYVSTPRPQAKLRIMTINTSGKIEDFEKYQTYAMLTARDIVYYEDGQKTVQSLDKVPDLVLSRKTILGKIGEFKNKYQPVTLLSGLIYASPLWLTLLFLLHFFFKVLGVTILAWVLNKILSTQLPFTRLWGMVGLLFVLPMILLQLVSAIPVLQPFYNWIYTLLDVMVLAIAYVILRQYKALREGEI